MHGKCVRVYVPANSMKLAFQLSLNLNHHTSYFETCVIYRFLHPCQTQCKSTLLGNSSKQFTKLNSKFSNACVAMFYVCLRTIDAQLIVMRTTTIITLTLSLMRWAIKHVIDPNGTPHLPVSLTLEVGNTVYSRS